MLQNISSWEQRFRCFQIMKVVSFWWQQSKAPYCKKISRFFSDHNGIFSDSPYDGLNIGEILLL